MFPVPKEVVAYIFFLEHSMMFFVGRVESCSVLYFGFFGIISCFLFLTGLIIIMSPLEFVYSSQLLLNSSSDFKFLWCQSSILLMQFECFIKDVKKGVFIHSLLFQCMRRFCGTKGSLCRH